MTDDRFVVYRKNGKCIVDTNAEEDEGIFFIIHGRRVSLEDLMTSIKVFMGFYDYMPRPKPEPKEDFESWKIEARAFNTCLQAILCEHKDKIEALEKFQKHIERQMQACLKDLNGGMQPGETVSLDSRVNQTQNL